MSEITSSAPPSRGPADHTVRDQIVEAAGEHFSHYGYEKTTVSDLAKSIGFSKAYIYKFFDSKQAIGEAICSKTLSAHRRDGRRGGGWRDHANGKIPQNVQDFGDDERESVLQRSQAVRHRRAMPPARDGRPPAPTAQRIKQILTDIVREGRETGEFERKTPLDETVHAIYLVMQPYVNPLLLQHNLDVVEEAPVQLSNLVLRSLAP